MSKKEITLADYTSEELTRDFPYFYEFVSKQLPELSRNQVLKVMAVSLSVCRECHNAPTDCQCWNDD